MAGGLLNLVSQGQQNTILNGNVTLLNSIKLKQSGGGISKQMIEYKENIESKLTEYDIKLINFEEEKKDINIMIISCKEEHKEKKPVLVVMAGYSHNSFRGTADILIKNIDALIKKFNKIYIIEYDSYKADQTIACRLRDDTIKQDTNDNNLIYEPERKLNNKIAIRIDNIIRSELKLSNVHLLGKCAGAGVLIHTLVKDTTNHIYDALYLAVPGNPFNIIELENISKERLKDLKFIFSWTKQDVFPFDWGKTSIEEKDVYNDAMKELAATKKVNINYTILEEDLKKDNDKKLYHEINQKLINAILL
jgi:hypothetical protein